MSHHWRPYPEINKEAPGKSGLVHTIIGIIVIALLIGMVIVLASIFQPTPPAINDRAPAIEKLEVM